MTPFPNTTIDVVALASSAGGLHALSTVLSRLPARFPAAIVVIQHMDPRHPSQLSHILGRRTPMLVTEAAEGGALEPGGVAVAPPGHHLIVNSDGTVSLTMSVPVHFVRPSADLLFASVAASFGARSIGVVLTGSGTDGADGVRAIRQSGGVVIAQDQGTSEFFGMPGAAIDTGLVNYVLPLDEIADALAVLVRGGAL